VRDRQAIARRCNLPATRTGGGADLDSAVGEESGDGGGARWWC
jgi:hypothetical protein